MRDILVGVLIADAFLLAFVLGHLIAHILEVGWFTPVG